MTYQLALLGGVVLIDGNKRVSIPANPENVDYQAYLAWLNEGNVPEPAEES